MLIIAFLFLIAGVFCIFKYKKTKEKKWLIFGLIFTFILIGALVYIYIGTPNTMMDYGPPDSM